MKTMKFLMLTLLFVLSTTACNGGDKVITVKDLPVTAQSLINRHFKDKGVLLVKKESHFGKNTFEVRLKDGTELEFDEKSGWTEIDCKQQAVPTELIPAAILDYVKQNYPDAMVKKIERRKRGFEIDLTNGLDIKFDKNFEVTDIDD